MDSCTRVKAVCDYKTKRGNSNGIKCAGAAEITFQVKIISSSKKKPWFLFIFYLFIVDS